MSDLASESSDKPSNQEEIKLVVNVSPETMTAGSEQMARGARQDDADAHARCDRRRLCDLHKEFGRVRKSLLKAPEDGLCAPFDSVYGPPPRRARTREALRVEKEAAMSAMAAQAYAVTSLTSPRRPGPLPSPWLSFRPAARSSRGWIAILPAGLLGAVDSSSPLGRPLPKLDSSSGVHPLRARS